MAACRVRCCCRRCSHLGGRAALKTKPRAASLAYCAEEMSPAVRCTQPSLTGKTPPWKMCPAQKKKKGSKCFCYLDYDDTSLTRVFSSLLLAEIKSHTSTNICQQTQLFKQQY